MPRFIVASALALAIGFGPGRALAAADDEARLFVAVGGHFAHIYEHPESALGFDAACVFPPATVGQFSETLEELDLGFALGYQRSVMKGKAIVEGMEITLRRYLDAGPAGLVPFLAFGLGQNAVKPVGEDARSTWSAVLSAGAEWRFSSRFLMQMELLSRSVEFSNDSFSMTTFTLTFGTRFDA